MFCKFCGKNLPDDANFCNYCGGDLRDVSQTIHKPVQPTRVSQAAEPQPVYNYNPSANKPKKGKGVLIALLALVLVFLAGIGGFYAYEKYNDSKEEDDSRIETSKNTDSKQKDTNKEKEKANNKKDVKTENKKREKLDVKEAEKIAKGYMDMSGKTLYFSHDAETIADSYWEFTSDKECRLYNSDGSYYEGQYVVMEGDAGMRYTEKAFPDYGITYSELKSAVETNKDAYTNSMDYVVISFNDLVEYSALDDVVSDEDYPTSFFYGMKYDMDSYYVYELTGSNTSETYYFIDYDYAF